MAKENKLPEGISCIVNGDYKVGEMMTHDKRVPLVSATGSTRMGKIVAQACAARLGNSLLELGGNNAIIVTPDADVKMTVIGAVFGAVGTAGQRCTSTRRLIIHESIYDKVKDAIVAAYGQLRIGNPLDQNNHVGPLIDTHAVELYKKALDQVVAEGGKILVEGGVLSGQGYESGCYVKPAIAEAKNNFAPDSGLHSRPDNGRVVTRKLAVSLEELYDIRAVRVIVAEVKDCYAALGIVHSMFQPVPGEFDDYISNAGGNNNANNCIRPVRLVKPSFGHE